MKQPVHSTGRWPLSHDELHSQKNQKLFDKFLPLYQALLGDEKIPVNQVLIDTLKQVYIPFCSWLVQQKKHSPLIIGLNGAQGSGKSTLTKILSTLLEHGFNKKIVSLSIDDLYKTKHQREKLALDIHPLFATRGVPGTHDVDLGKSILNHLKQGTEPEVHIPVFDKSIDDRLQQKYWSKVSGDCDIVIFEGWCVGSSPQQERDLQHPVNQLEKDEDPDGTWRKFVNRQLETDYQDLFSIIDILIMLQIPNFNKVYEWRKLQEHKLKDAMPNKITSTDNTMSDDEIDRFIMHYERISRHTLKEMPGRADVIIHLDNDHQIKNIIKSL